MKQMTELYLQAMGLLGLPLPLLIWTSPQHPGGDDRVDKERKAADYQGWCWEGEQYFRDFELL